MLSHFLDELSREPEDTRLVVMPISRVLVESACYLEDFLVVPPGEIDLLQFRPIPNKVISGPIGLYQGQTLREVQTSATGFNVDVLNKSALVVFTIKVDWQKFFV